MILCVILYQNESLPLENRRPEIFCQKVPEDATAASTPASAAPNRFNPTKTEKPPSHRGRLLCRYGSLYPQRGERNGVEALAKAERVVS